MKIIIKIRIFPQYIWLRMAKLSWQFWYFLHLKFIEKSRIFVFQSTYKCNKVTHENITFVILIFSLTYIIIISIFDSIYFHWTVKLCWFFFLFFYYLKLPEKSRSTLKKKQDLFSKDDFFSMFYDSVHYFSNIYFKLFVNKW